MSESNPLADLSKVRHVEANDPVSAQVSAQPTRALELAIMRAESLVASLQTATSLSRIIIPNVSIKEGVGIDDAVFFNANTGLYEKALAEVTFFESYQLNPSALAVGVIVSVNGSKGDLHIGGFSTWRDSQHMAALLESDETFVPGVPLYVSAREPGRLTRFAPALRIQVMHVTADHYIMMPVFANPDSMDVQTKVGLGMRPVGGIRLLPPYYDRAMIVGFDALENTSGSVWAPTASSAVETLRDFGYLVADASITKAPANPIYVLVEVSDAGVVSVVSANTLAALELGGGSVYNSVTLAALNGSSWYTNRIYALEDGQGNPLGEMQFRFTSSDISLKRRVFFKIPHSFQGWKQIHPSLQPSGVAVLDGDEVDRVEMGNCSCGFLTAPEVVFTGGGGTGAAGTAVLNSIGVITGVTITNRGADYTSAPVVTFVTRVLSLDVLNGGSGGEVSLTLSADEVTAADVDSAGSGYIEAPHIRIEDDDGPGQDAVVVAAVADGSLQAVTVQDGGFDYADPVAIVEPAGNDGYQKTTAGTPGSVTVHADGYVTAIGFTGGHNYQQGAQARVTGGTPTVQATGKVNVDANGVVTSVTITEPGEGYTLVDVLSVEVDQKDPVVVFSGGDPTTPAEASLTLSVQGLDYFEIQSGGTAYTDPEIVLTGGLDGGGVQGTVQAVLDADGRIIRIKILERGGPYLRAPAVSVTDDDGHNAVIKAHVGCFVVAATVDDGGEGYTNAPVAAVGVPLKSIQVDVQGNDYNAAPDVEIGAPEDPDGVQAKAVAHLGFSVDSVVITNQGAGYTNLDDAEITWSGGGGTGLVILPVMDGGMLIGVDVVNAGYGFTSAPTLSLVCDTGADAALSAVLEGEGQVVAIELTEPGKGYTQPPEIVVGASLNGTVTRASAILLGQGARLQPNLAGEGGLRSTSAQAFSSGNHLQTFSFADDLDDAGGVEFARPAGAMFYYNVKAHPEMLQRYPAVPVNKASLVVNGTELNSAGYEEGLAASKDLQADVWLSRKTLFWTLVDASGCPWDEAHQHYVNDPFSTGTDHVLQNTGLTDDEDNWWRFMEHVFKYEGNVNRAWLHINRASRFYQTGRVNSIGTVAPLRLIDMATGVESGSDGRPMSGQLLLLLDNQVNILGKSVNQVDATRAGELKSIYQNNTGRKVFISSIMLVVAYQLNSGNLLPTVANNAKITIGTQAGGYRNIVGTIDPDAVQQEGMETKLYATGQAKELFPDARESYALIEPNEQIYLRVDSPAGAPVVKQILTVLVKGHVI